MKKESAKTEINKQDSKRKQELEKQITEVNKALQKHIIRFLAGGEK